MFARKKNQHVDLSDTLALRLLRSCPKAMDSLNVPVHHKQAICEFRKNLAVNARKPITLSLQNMPCVSCDERCILNGLAAAQKNDDSALERTLEWLAPYWAKNPLKTQFKQIANILTERHIQLDVSSGTVAPIRREEPGLYSVIG